LEDHDLEPRILPAAGMQSPGILLVNSLRPSPLSLSPLPALRDGERGMLFGTLYPRWRRSSLPWAIIKPRLRGCSKAGLPRSQSHGSIRLVCRGKALPLANLRDRVRGSAPPSPM